MSASDRHKPALDHPTPDPPTADHPTADHPTADHPTTDQPEPEHPIDARLLLPATASWLTAAVLTAQPSHVSFITAASATALGLTLTAISTHPRRRHLPTRDHLRHLSTRHLPTRRGVRHHLRHVFTRHRVPHLSTWLAIAAVIAAMACAAALQVKKLNSGPVTDVAASNSTAKLRLKLTSDPAIRSTPGARRPPYVVIRATVQEITSKGETTRIHTPILVIGSPAWQHVRLGQHVETRGRLSPVDPGSDVAAMLSARASPHALDEPPWWLRAAEHVRAGLRESVAGQPTDVRGLVPALVMGDESALPADLVEDFETTGLTHLSAVSGTNVEGRDGCASSTAALARRPLCWRPAGYRSGAAARAQLDSERSASKGCMWRLCSPESDQGFLALGSSRGADEFAPSIGPGMYPDRSRSLSGARGTR